MRLPVTLVVIRDLLIASWASSQSGELPFVRWLHTETEYYRMDVDSDPDGNATSESSLRRFAVHGGPPSPSTLDACISLLVAKGMLDENHTLLQEPRSRKRVPAMVVDAVSYTHLTLPTTPYV